MTFDKLVTGKEYLRECERAARGEISIEQVSVIRKGAHHWRIVGREFSPEERTIKRPGSAFTNKQSAFKL